MGTMKTRQTNQLARQLAGNRRTRPTIKDVGRAAHVSQATASYNRSAPSRSAWGTNSIPLGYETKVFTFLTMNLRLGQSLPTDPVCNLQLQPAEAGEPAASSPEDFPRFGEHR